MSQDPTSTPTPKFGFKVTSSESDRNGKEPKERKDHGEGVRRWSKRTLVKDYLLKVFVVESPTKSPCFSQY